MKSSNILFVFLALCFFSSCTDSSQSKNNLPQLVLTDLEQIAEVEERYQSVNVEMCEVVGGDFWIPYELIDTAKVKAEGF